MESEKVCRSCGTTNSSEAERCANCGTALDSVPQTASGFVDQDPSLRQVDSNNRVELEPFERWDEAEIACGLLRSNGIACELSPMPLPGLPADIVVWVHNRHAKLAWALLEDAERHASETDDEAA